MIANYTSPTSIRALLGVSDKELPDTTVLDSFYWLSLQAELRRIAADIFTDYADAVELADTDVAAEQFTNAVSLFSAYAVARSCMVAMPQFAARSVTDGKAGFIRHTSTSFDNAVSRFDVEYARARAAVVEAYKVYKPTASITADILRSCLSVSGVGTDPVTGV